MHASVSALFELIAVYERARHLESRNIGDSAPRNVFQGKPPMTHANSFAFKDGSRSILLPELSVQVLSAGTPLAECSIPFTGISLIFYGYSNLASAAAQQCRRRPLVLFLSALLRSKRDPSNNTVSDVLRVVDQLLEPFPTAYSLQQVPCQRSRSKIRRGRCKRPSAWPLMTSSFQ